MGAWCSSSRYHYKSYVGLILGIGWVDGLIDRWLITLFSMTVAVVVACYLVYGSFWYYFASIVAQCLFKIDS